MKLLLIQPSPQQSEHSVPVSIVSRLARRNYFSVPSLALGILAALTPKDWEIKIIQEPNHLVDFNESADLVGITAVTHTVNRGYEIADQFRKRGVKVIMGGIHPSVLVEEALLHCDSVCVGEAELIWSDVLEDLKKRTLKRVYKAGQYFDMKSYVPPRRDLMPKSGSFFYSADTVETSRGCPHNCDFCSVSLSHGNRIRYRTNQSVVSEVEKTSRKRMFFVDNNIIANPFKAKELFQHLKPLKKKWTGQSTISITRDLQLLKLAADSGCYGLLIGIENVTDEGFKKYKKSVNSYESLKKAVRILKDHGIAVFAHMVIGNDFDSKESLSLTNERLAELELASASLGILVPYPGTQLAKNLEKQNRIVSYDWNKYDIHHLVFKPANFTNEDFISEVRQLREVFFSYRNMISRSVKYRDPRVFGFNLSSKTHNQVFGI